tara:strand:+ start:266 stop:484 length:219 start_codon:yes stop_codon:yes gene_type:complete
MKNSLVIFSLNLFLNLLLFIFMILCIQNTSKYKNIDFIFFKTIPLPVSFIIGSSFIVGSINGGIIANQLKQK